MQISFRRFSIWCPLVPGLHDNLVARGRSDSCCSWGTGYKSTEWQEVLSLTQDLQGPARSSAWSFTCGNLFGERCRCEYLFLPIYFVPTCTCLCLTYVYLLAPICRILCVGCVGVRRKCTCKTQNSVPIRNCTNQSMLSLMIYNYCDHQWICRCISRREKAALCMLQRKHDWLLPLTTTFFSMHCSITHSFGIVLLALGSWNEKNLGVAAKSCWQGKQMVEMSWASLKRVDLPHGKTHKLQM